MHNKDREMPVLPLRSHSRPVFMFWPESSIKWGNRYDYFCEVEWRRAKEEEEVGRPPSPNNVESAYCQKEMHLMNVSSFCLELAGVTSGGVSLRPELLYMGTSLRGSPPLSLVTGSERESMHTFMHKCLLHALNWCVPDGFLFPDALSMRAAICITAPTHTGRAPSSQSLFGASIIL